MGRLFDTQESSTTPSKPTTGRLFTGETTPKPTLGDRINKGAEKVTNFFGGKALSEAIGASIARSRATEEEKQYIEAPTAKQTLASAGELALNLATLPVGGGAVKGAMAAAKASKAVKYGKLAAEGALLTGASSGLRSVQEGNDLFSKETAKQTLIGGAIGATAGPVLGFLGNQVGKLGKRGVKEVLPETGDIVDDIIPNKIDEVMPSKLSPQDKLKVYSQKQGYEPYVPTEELPTIQMGNVPKTELPTVQIGEPTPKKVKGDFTYEPIVEPKPTPVTKTVSDIVEPKVIKETKQTTKNTYDFNESQITKAEEFIKRTDPEFESGSLPKYKEAFNQLDRNDLVDIATGVKKAPENIPATVVKSLTKELPDLTKAERNRLAKSTFVQSKAGSELSGARYLKDEVIKDPYTYTAQKQKELIDKALEKGYTSKTISRFLDDLEC